MYVNTTLGLHVMGMGLFSGISGVASMLSVKRWLQLRFDFESMTFDFHSTAIRRHRQSNRSRTTSESHRFVITAHRNTEAN